MGYCDEYLKQENPTKHAACEAWWRANDKSKTFGVLPPNLRFGFDLNYKIDDVEKIVTNYIMLVKSNKIPEYYPGKTDAIVNMTLWQNLPGMQLADIKTIMQELFNVCTGVQESDYAISYPCVIKPNSIPDCFNASLKENQEYQTWLAQNSGRTEKSWLEELTDMLQTIMLIAVLGVAAYFLIKLF